MENDNLILTKKRIYIYLIFTIGSVFLCGILANVLPDEIGKQIYSVLAAIFTAIPVLSVIITRKLTKDKSPWNLSLKVWKNWKTWLGCAFLPGVAIFLGAVIFYSLFPNDLDYSAAYLAHNYSVYGVPQELNLTTFSIIKAGLVTILISAAAIPLQLFELGEEIGWRGYLLPLLCKAMEIRKAVVISGILWGIAHAPLIYFGFNYGLDYYGVPYTGILMMIFLCMVFGIWSAYVTIKTGNCMYAAIMHGVMNLIGETPIFVTLSTKSRLLGPQPTGIIGMSVIILGAVILFVRMKNVKSKLT